MPVRYLGRSSKANSNSSSSSLSQAKKSARRAGRSVSGSPSALAVSSQGQSWSPPRKAPRQSAAAATASHNVPGANPSRRSHAMCGSRFLRYHWDRRSTTAPEKWDLAFAVFFDGKLVGSQAVHAREFPVLREVHTGSYLSRRAQGVGVGARMRAMVLELSFAHFGAEWATSGFVEGNERSRRVSARLGYEADGVDPS
jgi:RimJ/RimL family protein N-acetyltransferase